MPRAELPLTPFQENKALLADDSSSPASIPYVFASRFHNGLGIQALQVS
jgi:hypothetical protein